MRSLGLSFDFADLDSAAQERLHSNMKPFWKCLNKRQQFFFEMDFLDAVSGRMVQRLHALMLKGNRLSRAFNKHVLYQQSLYVVDPTYFSGEHDVAGVELQDDADVDDADVEIEDDGDEEADDDGNEEAVVELDDVGADEYPLE